jgi:uncharacterized protein (UPF0335 family)
MTLPNASQRALRDYISSIENLEVEKKAIADDIKEKYAEAKGAGFDAKAMRKIIKLRKQSPDDRDHEQAILDTYLHALESFDGTPMGEHIARHAPEAERVLEAVQ